MAMDMSVAHAYGADGRRLITPEYPPLTDWEMKNLDADRLHVYADTQYQYEQEMRVRWENFTQANYRLHCEVQKLCQVAQQQFCLENARKREEHTKTEALHKALYESVICNIQPAVTAREARLTSIKTKFSAILTSMMAAYWEQYAMKAETNTNKQKFSVTVDHIPQAAHKRDHKLKFLDTLDLIACGAAIHRQTQAEKVAKRALINDAVRNEMGRRDISELMDNMFEEARECLIEAEKPESILTVAYGEDKDIDFGAINFDVANEGGQAAARYAWLFA